MYNISSILENQKTREYKSRNTVRHKLLASCVAMWCGVWCGVVWCGVSSKRIYSSSSIMYIKGSRKFGLPDFMTFGT
jgi:hypothetical protein